jgi:hypothetical protein
MESENSTVAVPVAAAVFYCRRHGKRGHFSFIIRTCRANPAARLMIARRQRRDRSDYTADREGRGGDTI